MGTRSSHNFVFAVTAVLLAAISMTATAATVVKDVRLSATVDTTRVVFDLSQPAVVKKVFTLSSPDRVVLDLSDAQLQLSQLPEGRGQIKKMGAGEPEKGVLRLVLHVAGPVEVRNVPVEPNEQLGYRLVLDLTPAGAKSTPMSAESTTRGAADMQGARPLETAKSLDQGRDIVVAIDAGHGGEDPGAIGRRGTREKDVTLAVARKLKARIDAEPGMRAVLTRDADVYVPLPERVARASKLRADMFVSIHADSVRDRDVKGSSVYVLSARRASTEAARMLEDRENAEFFEGVRLNQKDDVLASVLLDLSQGASMSASVEAADHVLAQLDRVGVVLDRDVKQASLKVLTSPEVPSMLVETAFISNPSEEAKLRTATHQQNLADAVHAGVRAYFYQNPLPGTHIAQLKAQQRKLAQAGGNSAAGTSMLAAGGAP